MNDDLDYVRERLDPYRAYSEEGDRHDSDMRVRAYVGGALSEAQARLGETLDARTCEVLDAVLVRCMFTDQAFIRKFQHGALDATTVAGLVHSDRRLVELGDAVRTTDAGGLEQLLRQIDHQFDARRSPEAVA